MADLREDVLAIVNEHSGGVKGLELMSELILRRKLEINPDTFFDRIEELIHTRIPELGFLKYGHQLETNLMREKVFVYRKLDCCG